MLSYQKRCKWFVPTLQSLQLTIVCYTDLRAAVNLSQLRSWSVGNQIILC